MSNATVTSPVRSVESVEVPVAGTYAIDPSHTHVGFSVRHLMVSKVKGSFSGVSGTINIADDPLQSSVEVSVDMASIDTRDEQRDAHLRSPDFFDVENFPTMTYASTAVRADGGNRWLVDGELTIHGVTRSVPLEVTFEGAGADPWGGLRAGFSARAEIDREDFGLTWNQVLETGGIAVGKKVTIDLEVEAVLQA
jgi:polyisoprenoid-binding protein YceI